MVDDAFTEQWNSAREYWKVNSFYFYLQDFGLHEAAGIVYETVLCMREKV